MFFFHCERYYVLLHRRQHRWAVAFWCACFANKVLSLSLSLSLSLVSIKIRIMSRATVRRGTCQSIAVGACVCDSGLVWTTADARVAARRQHQPRQRLLQPALPVIYQASSHRLPPSSSSSFSAVAAALVHRQTEGGRYPGGQTLWSSGGRG